MSSTIKEPGDRISVSLLTDNANRSGRAERRGDRVSYAPLWRSILTMFATFFCQAARAPGRQRLFRRAVVAHILLLTALVVLLPLSPRGGVPLTLFGQFL